MKIGIVYGHVASNVGDLTINRGVAGMLHQVAPDAEVHVVLRDPNEAYLEGARAEFKEIERLTFGVLSTGRTQGSGASNDDSARLARAMEYVLEPARFIADAGLTDCDVVLGNSGELLFAYENGRNHIDLVWNMLPAFAAKAAGLTYVTLPSTFGPFEAPSLESMVRSFFALNDALAVREARSPGFVEPFLGVTPPALLDPAFFISSPTQTSIASDGPPTLGLALRLEGFGSRTGAIYGPRRHFTVYGKEGVSESSSFRFGVAAARSFLDRSEGKARLIVASALADRELMHAIAGALAEQGYGERLAIAQPASVAEYCEELGRASFIVASRFHACILGFLSGRPVMGVYFDEHGHKMPGLFDMLGVPDYCHNLSQIAPESAAESVVPLFHRSETAYAEMPARLHAMRDQTIEWLKQALAGKATVRPEQLEAAATAYTDGIHTIRSRTAPDMRHGTARLQAESEALSIELDVATDEASRRAQQARRTERRLNALENSFSYRLGALLVKAIRTPGLHTVLLPVHAFRLLRTRTGSGTSRRAESIAEPAAPGRGIAANVEARARKLLKDGRLGVWVALAERHGDRQYFRQNARVVHAKYRLLQHGFKPATAGIRQNYEARKDTVFYLLHNSLPYASGGYAIRTHGLLKGLMLDGWQMYGVTRPGFPLDVKAKRGLNVPQVSAGEAIPDMDVIDNVPYSRLLEHEDTRSALPPDTDLYIRDYIVRVLKLCKSYRPGIIHAASFFWNGIAAVNAARILGLPSVYSVRGLWYLTGMSTQPGWACSDEYEMQVRMDTDACLQATAVITITEALKKQLVSRGVPGEKILVVPNGVDTKSVVPVERDRELEARLGYASKKVIGYIGAFAQYEGLEYLLHAASILRSRGRDDFRVMLVGDGAKYDELQAVCDELQVRELVTIVGRVPHSEIQRYYSLTDAVALPRKGVPVCEIVSPLKPFEAMSMGKALVVSDVAALAEIVIDGKTGLLHRKDDVEHLAHTLETLLDNPDLTGRLGEAAREWVVANRDWRDLAKGVGDLYRDLIGRRSE